MAEDPQQSCERVVAGLREALPKISEGGVAAADTFFGKQPFATAIVSGDWLIGVLGGKKLLELCQIADPLSYSALHKGFPFYWIGMGAFLINDYEMAVFFVDAAVSEDLRAGFHAGDQDPTPALLFLQLDGKKLNQAGKDLVKEAEGEVKALIDDYNGRSGTATPALRMEDVRAYFLTAALDNNRPGWRSMATAFISFILEGKDRRKLFDLRPAQGTAEPFLLHLFKGCLLFESLLKAILPPDRDDLRNKDLKRVLNHHKYKMGIAFQSGHATLEDVIKKAAEPDRTIKTSVQLTYNVRNVTGHNLGWNESLSRDAYESLFKMIASSCLHAIATLYRPNSPTSA